MKMNIVAFIIVISSASLCVAGSLTENTPSPVKWLTDGSTIRLPVTGITRVKANRGIYPAPDYKRYAVANTDQHGTVIYITSYNNPKFRVVVYKSDSQNKSFEPIEMEWSPDASILVVHFGSVEYGTGLWFDFNSTTGKLIKDKTLFKKLSSLPREKWPEPMNDPDYNGFAPVWTVTGERIHSESQLGNTNTHLIYHNPLGGIIHRQKIGHLEWYNGKYYDILNDPIDSKDKAFIIDRHEGIIGKVQLQLVGSVMYIKSHDHLIMRYAWWRDGNGGDSASNSASSLGVMSVDFGKARLGSTTLVDRNRQIIAVVSENKEHLACWYMINLPSIRDAFRSDSHDKASH